MRNSRRGRSAANWRRRPSKRAGGTGSTRVPARTNPPSGGIAKVVSGYSLVIPAQAGAPLCLSLEFRFRGKDASGRGRVFRPQHLIFRNAAARRPDGKRGSAGAPLRSGCAVAVRLSSPVSRLCGKRERGAGAHAEIAAQPGAGHAPTHHRPCKWGRQSCRPHSHRLRYRRLTPKGSFARRSRRHPVPSGGSGWSGGPFPSRLAVP